MKANNGKLWAVLNDGEFEVRTITEAELEESLDVLEHFFRNETVCIATEICLPENVQARQELRELCRLTAYDGVSLYVRHVASGRIAAVSFNKIQYVLPEGEQSFFNKFRDEKVKSPQALRLMHFMIGVDEMIDVCSMFNMNCYNELMFLGTDPAFGRKGLGRILGQYTIELTKQYAQGIGLEDIDEKLRDKRPAAVTALWTSRFSQKIGAALGFKVLNTVSFTDFSYNGKQFSERIGDYHTHCEHVAYVF